MKHTKKKRLLAIVLCMILVLSTGIAAFANENVGLQSVACQAATLERVIKNAEGEDVGTLIADIPEGAFLASSSDANIQMDVQADVGDGYWYYNDVLQAGQTTEKELNITYKFPSGDQKPEEFNVVVIQECTPILYDEDGNAYADWDNVVTDSSNTQE